MSRFSDVFFGNSRFIRWTLTPFIVFFAIFMPWLLNQSDKSVTWNWDAILILSGIELMCISVLAGFWLPRRLSRLGFRVLTGMIFLFYTCYIIEEFFLSDKSFDFFDDHDGLSPFEALTAYILIGLPSLWHTLWGRFTLRTPAWEKKNDT